MKTNKYTYLKVIQQNYGNGWEDVSEYETNSSGNPLEYLNNPKIDGVRKSKCSLLRHDLKEYRLTGYPTRVIRRKSINEDI